MVITMISNMKSPRSSTVKAVFFLLFIFFSPC